MEHKFEVHLTGLTATTWLSERLPPVSTVDSKFHSSNAYFYKTNFSGLVSEEAGGDQAETKYRSVGHQRPKRVYMK